MNNLIIEDVSLIEIMNGLNTGFYQYNDIRNIRISNSLKPEYIIFPVEADISESILDFIDSDKDKQNYDAKNIVLDTTILDYVIVLKDTTTEPGKYKITTMSVLELITATSQLDSEEKIFDLNSETFKCIEINYIEQESEIPTDMNLLG